MNAEIHKSLPNVTAEMESWPLGAGGPEPGNTGPQDKHGGRFPTYRSREIKHFYSKININMFWTRKQDA